MKTCKEMAAIWNVTERTVTNFCKNGRIPGASKAGRSWTIPDDAQKPVDRRLSSGKYRKKLVNEERKSLPIGISDYVRAQSEYYYVDKTLLIKDFLDQKPLVSLFTRPRRFGKTLNMSMLRYFFEIGTDVKLFEELFIAQNHELCEKYMGKYPVVSISLKSINADSYSKAKAQLIKLVNREGRRVQFLMDSDRLTAVDKALFTALLDREMEEDTLVSSIQELTELLEIHFNQKVIVLIDEYDVPLAKANQNGYYDKMVLLLRNFLENVLKTNESLEFAVLTGCLRIAKKLKSAMTIRPVISTDQKRKT